MTISVKTSFIALLPVFGLLSACGGGEDSPSSAAETTAASSQQSSLPQGSEPSNLDPADFTTNIDNPYFPVQPGARWEYRETAPGEAVQQVVVKVLDANKTMANGVKAAVVSDIVSIQGEPVEVTEDYYGQDSEGNVWYLGENTAEYENGKVTSREGSFEAGADGAEAGIIMPADPQPGQAFRQEYRKGQAEDQAEIMNLDAKAQPAAGYYPETLITKETNPLEPRVSELKFYAKGVGIVLGLDSSGGAAREELISYEPGS